MIGFRSWADAGARASERCESGEILWSVIGVVGVRRPFFDPISAILGASELRLGPGMGIARP